MSKFAYYSSNDHALVGIAIAAESWLEWNNISLNCEVILSSPKQEVSIHTPILIVWVSHDPVFCVCFVVKAPADQCHRVVLVLPRETTVFHCFLAWCLLSWGLSFACWSAVIGLSLGWCFLFQWCWLVIHFGVCLNEYAINEWAEGLDAAVIIQSQSLKIQGLLSNTILRQNSSMVGLK